MSEIVVPEKRWVVLPHTGEVVPFEDPVACANAIEEIRNLEWKLREAKNELTRVFLEESERQGSKTMRWEGLEVVLSASETPQWDVTELIKLRDLGLPEGRYDALVKEEVTYKVSAAEAKRIAGANPEYAEVIERAKTMVPRNPSVKVSRG
jgi:hypothetical protein